MPSPRETGLFAGRKISERIWGKLRRADGFSSAAFSRTESRLSFSVISRDELDAAVGCAHEVDAGPDLDEVQRPVSRKAAGAEHADEVVLLDLLSRAFPQEPENEVDDPDDPREDEQHPYEVPGGDPAGGGCRRRCGGSSRRAGLRCAARLPRAGRAPLSGIRSSDSLTVGGAAVAPLPVDFACAAIGCAAIASAIAAPTAHTISFFRFPLPVKSETSACPPVARVAVRPVPLPAPPRRSYVNSFMRSICDTISVTRTPKFSSMTTTSPLAMSL